MFSLNPIYKVLFWPSPYTLLKICRKRKRAQLPLLLNYFPETGLEISQLASNWFWSPGYTIPTLLPLPHRYWLNYDCGILILIFHYLSLLLNNVSVSDIHEWRCPWKTDAPDPPGAGVTAVVSDQARVLSSARAVHALNCRAIAPAPPLPLTFIPHN